MNKEIAILSKTTSDDSTPELKSCYTLLVDNRIIAAYFNVEKFVYKIWASDGLPLEKEVADDIKFFLDNKLSKDE